MRLIGALEFNPQFTSIVTLFFGGAVQKCSDARRAKTVPRGVFKYTLSGAVCSTTQQTMVPFRV